MIDEQSAAERLVNGNHPSALELLVGRAGYIDAMISQALMYSLVVLLGGAVALACVRTSPGRNVGGVAAMVIVTALLITSIPLVGRRTKNMAFFAGIAIAAGLIATGVVFFAGPAFGVTVSILPSYAGALYLFFNRRVATVAAVVAFGLYALVVSLQSGHTDPVSRLLWVGATILATALMSSRLIGYVESLARRERELHGKVADANAQLRRFVAPQVADTVMAAGGVAALDTHRRRIAVVFVDLRGFTAFSAVAEPEDVVEVLADFYAVVGAAAQRANATVGSFAGDGVMAYFNDPVPCDNPAGSALEMVMALRDPMTNFSERWGRRGFRIGFGAGVSYGYATLGTIGFDERRDYTPLGSVVNLASRLCDEASSGGLLLDASAHDVVAHLVEAEQVSLMLKGFNDPVTAYRVAL